VNPDVSRSLATFIAANNLGRESARELAGQFADVNQAEDLPEWVRELDDEFDGGELEDDDLEDEEPDTTPVRAAAGDLYDEDYEPTDEDWLDLADADPDEISAAAGRDITPGRERLHHYWTRGKGLARWVASPHPWTTLVALLSKHVSAGKAKRFASKWFKEVFGIWPGERKGDNPVGPG
jgi:hypothetical protein